MAIDTEVTIHIDAPPARVYELVADISRMGEWSPETYRTEWIDEATGAVPGARFKGYNRYGRIKWATTVEIETADPGRQLSFATRFGKKTVGTRWSFGLRPEGGGTQLTQTRENLWTSRVVRGFEAVFMRGHEASFEASMRQTLERIKAAAEAKAAAPA